MTEREALVAQLIRDIRVADEDPIYHVPSLQFYIDRAVAYKKDIDELDRLANS